MVIVERSTGRRDDSDAWRTLTDSGVHLPHRSSEIACRRLPVDATDGQVHLGSRLVGETSGERTRQPDRLARVAFEGVNEVTYGLLALGGRTLGRGRQPAAGRDLPVHDPSKPASGEGVERVDRKDHEGSRFDDLPLPDEGGQ